MKKRICTLVIFALLAFSLHPVHALEGIVKNTPKGYFGFEIKLDISVDKNTTDKELQRLKNDLAKDNIAFNYKAIRNKSGEIIKISLTVTGKNSTGKRFAGTYSDGSQKPIMPIKINFDADNNRVTFLSDAKSQGLYERNAKYSNGAKTSAVYATDQDVYSPQDQNLGRASLESNARGTNLMSVQNIENNTTGRDLKKSENRYADQDNVSISGTNAMPFKNNTKATGKLSVAQTKGKQMQSQAQDQDEIAIKDKD